MAQQHLDYLLHLADNALVLGQRNAEWCGHGPILEEDLALANMSLDLIGQARKQAIGCAWNPVLFMDNQGQTQQFCHQPARTSNKSTHTQHHIRFTSAQYVQSLEAGFEQHK